MKTFLPIVLASLLSVAGAAVAADANPDADLIKPYEGTDVGQKSVQLTDYDELEMPIGPRKGKDLTKVVKIAGRHTLVTYPMPAGRSVLEVYRNYEQAVKAAGLTIVFSCKEKECGTGEAPVKGFQWWPYSTGAYIAAKAPEVKDGLETWVALDIRPTGQTFHVFRNKPMEMDKAAVNAAALKGSIESEGHVAVYGIVFDTGKADLKPASEPVLAEIVKLLKENAALKIHVVGHTDNVGTPESNVTLSKRRAESVVRELTTKHGIAAVRLRAEGVGPFCPITTNGTEEGRAKNRRVDLVKQ